MTGQQDDQVCGSRLYRLLPSGAVEIHEVSEEILAQNESKRSATAREIRELIEALLEYLPDDDKQTFKQRIMTEGMI